MFGQDTEIRNVSYELIDKITDKELTRLVSELNTDEYAKGLLIELPEADKRALAPQNLFVC